ncbi:dUTP diphosphatase [Cytobacillus praedii]|uniref:dUTP diphosphatase n=1 Tax=Cytobacillus praedii TaxID=1742358 RepID=UPI003F7F16B1
MNLAKMFETQKILRDRINYNEPDRFDKLILALLVEIGECANEWRGFKFWIKDQKPRNKMEESCNQCDSYGTYLYWNFEPGVNKMVKCELCNGKGVIESKPLLEEYVDGLHFVLELGIEIGQTPIICDLYYKTDSIDSQFIGLYKYVLNFFTEKTADRYIKLLMVYVGLGEMLGFEWGQIETAYFEKNAINHARQENGY